MFTGLKVPFLNFITIKISKTLILHYFYSFTIYTYVMYVDHIPRLSSLKNFSTPVRSLFPTNPFSTLISFFMTYCVESIPCMDGYLLEQGQLSSDYTTKI